jgi:hypothetical protein
MKKMRQVTRSATMSVVAGYRCSAELVARGGQFRAARSDRFIRYE